jgi:hypothetical protein
MQMYDLFVLVQHLACFNEADTANDHMHIIRQMSCSCLNLSSAG